MRRNYGLGISVLFVLIALKIALVLSAPTDEHSVLNRIGHRIEVDQEPEELPFPLSSSYHPRHLTKWELTVPEPEARQILKRFVASHPNWQDAGTESEKSTVGLVQTTSSSIRYTNVMTAHQLKLSREIRTEGKQKTTHLTATLAEPITPNHTWLQMKRWLRLP